VPIAALILGIVGILFNLVPVVGFFIGGPLSLVALILGILGRKKAAAENAPTGMATAGMAMGIVGLALGVIFFVACSLCAAAVNKSAQESLNDPAFKKSMEDFNKQMQDNMKENK
jgi:hypothetical protein